MKTKAKEPTTLPLNWAQLQIWPTHWAGGASSVQFNGRNVPWVNFVDGSMMALLTDSTPTAYAFGNELVRRWNAHAELVAALEDALEFGTNMPPCVQAKARAALAKAGRGVEGGGE